jgi:predicted nucleotidyltransferase
MDLSDPTRAITATLDGAVLAALAVAGRPLTVGQVAEQAARGSEIGVRRSLARLVEQGVVRATLMGRNQVHELNRHHVAADIAVALAGLRAELWRRLRTELDSWRPRPLFAAVFGSAARGDGDAASDIDLLLVHPPFPGEKKLARINPKLSSQLADAMGEFVVSSGEIDPNRQWEAQIDRLRSDVENWSGNALQIVDVSFYEWRYPSPTSRALFDDIGRDGVEMIKSKALSLWTSSAARG